jgi:hypothetical protein
MYFFYLPNQLGDFEKSDIVIVSVKFTTCLKNGIDGMMTIG